MMMTRLRRSHPQNGGLESDTRRTRNSSSSVAFNPLMDPPNKRAKRGRVGSKNIKTVECHPKSGSRRHNRIVTMPMENYVTSLEEKMDLPSTSVTTTTPATTSKSPVSPDLDANVDKKNGSDTVNVEQKIGTSVPCHAKNLPNVCIVDPLNYTYTRVGTVVSSVNNLLVEDSVNLEEEGQERPVRNSRLRETIRNNPDQIVRAVKCQINVRKNGEWEVYVPGDQAMSLKLQTLLRERLGPIVPIPHV